MSVVFVDRDGVINEFPGIGVYVTKLEDFRLFPGTPKALALLSKAGHEVMIISNQGCIARGLITWEDLDRMTDILRRAVEKEGGRLAGVFYCPHRTSDNCDCHKPKIGLFKKALEGRSVDPASTYFLGDSEEDVKAGKNFGSRTVLLLSGRTQREDLAGLSVKPDHVMSDLSEAAQWILSRKKS